MTIESQIHRLREVLEPIMADYGHTIPADIPDDAFCGRLRRCLVSLSGGDKPVGFNYECTKTPAGDFRVMLEWQTDLAKTPASAPAAFMAHGETETLAFMRAAEMALEEEGYRKMLSREGVARPDS